MSRSDARQFLTALATVFPIAVLVVSAIIYLRSSAPSTYLPPATTPLVTAVLPAAPSNPPDTVIEPAPPAQPTRRVWTEFPTLELAIPPQPGKPPGPGVEMMRWWLQAHPIVAGIAPKKPTSKPPREWRWHRGTTYRDEPSEAERLMRTELREFAPPTQTVRMTRLPPRHEYDESGAEVLPRKELR